MILRIVLILVLQTLALAGMVAMKQWTLETGRPVLLRMEPIDPRSLFRGDYVTLNYAISTLDLVALEGDDDFSTSQDVYEVLEQGETYFEPRAVYHLHPGNSADRVALKGVVDWIQTTRYDQESKTMVEVNELHVRYGIEDYFVPEGEGRELERMNAQRIELEIAVDRYGGSGIRRILVDGEPRYQESML